MEEKYVLRDNTERTMFVFEKNGKVYGHIVKARTDKAPARLLFETEKYETIDALKAEYPERDSNT